MPRQLAIPAIALVILTTVAPAAVAESGIPYVGSIDWPLEPVTYLAVPDGSGPPLTQATTDDGTTVDGTITIWLVDLYFDPIYGFPPEDVWIAFEPGAGTIADCHPFSEDYFIADGMSDLDGRMTFTHPLAGGGWSEGPLWVYLNGTPAYGPDLIQLPSGDCAVNSPDLDGDGLVNLVDVTLFSVDFFGDDSFRSDLHRDGVVNLSDLSVFATYYGLACE